MDELIDVCVKNMVNEEFTEEQARSHMKELLPKLDYWKRYEELSDNVYSARRTDGENPELIFYKKR